eukprot:Seg1653.6 transcript_id=Seg1653.6/GoldUCD/mRNA.D3Y31 product="hypothetical protein" protein_id=Seg1653.6/GoldUCD/D3Y31
MLSRSRRKLSVRDSRASKIGAHEMDKQRSISKNILSRDNKQMQNRLVPDAVKKASKIGAREIDKQRSITTNALGKDEQVQDKPSIPDAVKKATSHTMIKNEFERLEIAHHTSKSTFAKTHLSEEASSTVNLKAKSDSSLHKQNANFAFNKHKENYEAKLISNRATLLSPLHENGEVENSVDKQSPAISVPSKETAASSIAKKENSNLTAFAQINNLTKEMIKTSVLLTSESINRRKENRGIAPSYFPHSEKGQQFRVSPKPVLNSMLPSKEKLSATPVSVKDQRINKTSKFAGRASYPQSTKPHPFVTKRPGKRTTSLAYSKLHSLSENLDTKKVDKAMDTVDTFHSVKETVSLDSKTGNISISDVEPSKYPISQDGMHTESLLESARSKPACQIPKLDPFDKAALVHMKQMNKLTCPQKYMSSLQNGELIVKGTNIVDAYFEYIKRPENDDNNVLYSGKIKITQGYKEGGLRVNSIGCLHHKVYGNIAIDSSTRASKSGHKLLVGVKDCDHHGFWFLTPHRTIQHYLRRLCISGNGKCRNESQCTMGLSTCSANSDKFTIGNGSIVHENTGNVLEIKENNGEKGKFEFTLVENANTSKWRILEATLQNVDFRRRIEDDFVKVTIIKDGEIHEEFLVQVVEKQNIINRAKQSIKKASLPYNVAFIMLDSQSKSNIIRKLPRLYNYLNKDENTFIFDGQSIVGDGTTAQLSAMLTGALEWELPESRRGFAGAKPIDNWPFIFKNLTSHGYVTFFSEDEALFGAFNYRLHGFTKPPADHYPRPFWLASKLGYYFQGVCHGDVSIAKRSFDYAASFYDSYKGIPKFSLTVLSAMVHNDLNKVENMEDDLLAMVKNMEKRGQLKDTFLIIFGDHGARLSEFRNTLTGKLEERLPFLSVTLPDDLVKRFPSIATAMEHNTKVLTSYFDIHATLHHLFTYPNQPDVKRGQSLFNKIDPRTRTCGTAGVKEHWCPCLQFTEENKTSGKVIKMAKTIVEFINENVTGIISEAEEKCVKLELHEVQRAGRKIPNEAVQRFKQTNQNSKCIECEVVYDNEASLDQHSIDYEIVFSVTPGNGSFEASVTVTNDKIVVNPEISRINRYGDQPKCIQNKYPLLRKYCYCRN